MAIVSTQEQKTMEYWSPYSEEWERQRIEKFIEKADAARKEFEKKPWLYKAIIRSIQTIRRKII